MGQTLTHGIYLPDEGERNCYSGLAANWQLLDGAVGTVAEHTTQIAGKASATHTHGNISSDGKVGTTANLPLITGTGGAVQAGSFGNQANTFCEGNDSRLSDARTPVAHTHTKSDVTDLLNSNFIPSANNSYDLGSSSYQWNNLYAKNYYYNGTAWGLDKANVWTGSNQYNESIRINGQKGILWARGGTVGTLPSSVLYYGFQNALDSNDNVFDRIRSYVGTAGTNFQEHVKYAWNDLTKYVTINFWINADGSDSEYKLSVKRVIPGASNATDLGTSTNKWKSLNGINPGALSLPNFDNADPIDFSQWDVTGAVGSNFYTPAVDGWLNISIWDRATNSIFVYRSGKERVGVFGNGSMASDGRIALLMPVQANATYVIIIKANANSDIYAANFFPCLGNV